MPCQFLIKLVDAQQTPAVGIKVRACLFKLDGQSEPVSQGQTDAQGSVLLQAPQVQLGPWLPRAVIEAFVGNGWRKAADEPNTVRGTQLDFGTCAVPAAVDPVAMRMIRPTMLGGMTAITPAVTDGGAARPATEISPTVLKLKDDQIRVNETQIMALNQQVLALRQQKDSEVEETRTKVREQTAAEFQAKLQDSEVRVASLQAALKASTAGAADVAKVSDQVRSEVTAKFQRDLQDRDQQITLLRGQLAQVPTGQGETTDVDTMMTHMGSQVASVQSRMVQLAPGVRLSKVSMDLKVLPQSGGRIGFVGKEDIKSGVAPAALSSIRMDLDLGAAVGTAAPSANVAVPSLANYAQTLAMRKLDAIGLRAQLEEEFVPAGDAGRRGRVLRQFPAAGQPVAPGAAVTLVIGRG